MKAVTEYEVIEHGFDHEQYFQGCGVAFTSFEDVATGIGYTAQDAFEDALDSLAQNDWDVSRIKGKSKLSRKTVRGFLRDQRETLGEDEPCEIWAYVSIRVQ